MKLTAIEKIENYHLVAIGIKDDGHCTAYSFNSLDENLVGLAARNIEVGEIIEYRPGENTKDILTKGAGFDQTGQSWSWSLVYDGENDPIENIIEHNWIIELPIRTFQV